MDTDLDKKIPAQEAPSAEDADDNISRREAMRALARYSAAVGGAAIVVMSSKEALSQHDTSDPKCFGKNPPPWCP